MMKIAVGMYCIVGALLLSGGLHYFVAAEFMPYHAKALSAEWGALSWEQQGLLLSLMKARGAGAVAVGGMIMLLALLGLPRRIAFVFWLLPLIALVYLGMSAYSTFFMHAHTHGGPPYLPGPALGALAVAAAALSHFARLRPGAVSSSAAAG